MEGNFVVVNLVSSPNDHMLGTIQSFYKVKIPQMTSKLFDTL